MKSVIISVLLVTASTAFAECTGGGTTCANASSETNSQANNDLTVVLPGTQARQEIVTSGTTTLRNVPSVGGPPLVSSNDTCMGSVSGGINIPGLGIGGGTTVIDSNCKLLKNARELWNMGMRAAALALMCKDPDNREALEVTDYKCPAEKKAVVIDPAPDRIRRGR